MTFPQGTTTAPDDQAIIEVTTSFFFLAFVLHLCKPRVVINGQAAIQSWGTVSIPVVPGRYQVEAWTNYFLAPEMGRNGVIVDATPGTITRVRWKAPWLIFLKGSIAVTDVAARGGAPLPSAATAPQAPAFAAAPPASAAPAPPAPPVASAAGAPAGWHPDPSGRHEQRYFDGSTWTEHVSTAGVAGTDRTDS